MGKARTELQDHISQAVAAGLSKDKYGDAPSYFQTTLHAVRIHLKWQYGFPEDWWGVYLQDEFERQVMLASDWLLRTWDGESYNWSGAAGMVERWLASNFSNYVKMGRDGSRLERIGLGPVEGPDA